jgi:tRNA(fMet)-specific endonuclease VapC
LGQKEVEKAAEIQAELNEAGTPLSIPDIFIASSAIVNDFILVTNNEGHFTRINELRLENWVKQNIKFT